MISHLARWLPVALLLGCSTPEPILECAGVGDFGVVCGFDNPEDLALLPDGDLLVSQFASMDGSRAGSITLFNPETEAQRVLFPLEGSNRGDKDRGDKDRGDKDRGDRDRGDEDWGADDCPGPPGKEFAPHGIDLATRSDGALQLLVVNHGGRESIEFFEVMTPPDPEAGAVALQWRGCAVPPEQAYLNDVVALPEGGFATTHMMPRDSQAWSMISASFGADTGHVYEWQRDAGWSKVTESDAPFPNGIEVSSDGETLYFAAYIGGEVRRPSRKTGELLGVAEDITQPDNLAWSADGRRLYVASHVEGFRTNFCTGLEAGACPVGFEIVALDPDTLERETVYAHEGGPPMGAATVALEVGDVLYLGTFAGDRIGKLRLR